MVKHSTLARLGLARATGQPQTIHPSPSRGGSRGYSIDARRQCINFTVYRAGSRILGASARSVRRWKNQRMIPMKMTGNKRFPRISGFDQFLLLFYRSVYPKANADEIRCFIFEHSPNPIIYSRSDITKAENCLLLTRKRGSTTAFEAFNNMFRRWLFRNSAPPTGVIGVAMRQFIDVDEAGIGLLSSNRHSGKAFINVRVGDIGPYQRTDKFTMICAVGPPNFKHMFIAKVPGTTTALFLAFINNLLLRFPVGTPRKTFLWDNLSSHFSDEIAYSIYAQGHNIVPRPAYYPADGPIEYVFNQIEVSLQSNLYHIRNDSVC